jgi:RNA polymerase sigma-70 factor (ECF subfamily)
MNREPEKKTSLLAPLAKQYELTEEGADRILAKIQKAYLEDASATSTASTRLASSTFKMSSLVGVACTVLAIAGMTIHVTTVSEPSHEIASPVSSTRPATVNPVSVSPESAQPAREPEPVVAMPSVSVDTLPSVTPSPGAPPASTAANRGSAKKPVGPAASDGPVGVASNEPGNAESLEREARFITDARLALQHGNGDQALARLDEHARQFPNGWFAADRAAERIVILCSLGRRAEAVSEAKVFLENRPKSPLARRVEASCAGQALTGAGK